jgi:nucleoside-diphosphate-sugar epimerase
MSTVLITGAEGFVGRHVVRVCVERGHAVHAMIRAHSDGARLARLGEVKAHRVDIGDSENVGRVLGEVRPQIVVHAAVYGAYPDQNDFAQMVTSNIMGTQTLLRSASETGVGLFVSLGSSSEYGKSDTAMREAARLAPDRTYGVTKVAQMHLTRLFETSTMRTITLRLFTVYGPGEPWGRLVPSLLRCALKGEPFKASSPNVARDFVWAEDVARVATEFALLDTSDARILNVGTGRQTDIGTLITLVEQATQRSIAVEWSREFGNSWDGAIWRADTTLFEQCFPNYCWTMLEQGLERFAAWMRAHFELELPTYRADLIS